MDPKPVARPPSLGFSTYSPSFSVIFTGSLLDTIMVLLIIQLFGQKIYANVSALPLYGEHFTKNAPEIDTERNRDCFIDTMDCCASGNSAQYTEIYGICFGDKLV